MSWETPGEKQLVVLEGERDKVRARREWTAKYATDASNDVIETKTSRSIGIDSEHEKLLEFDEASSIYKDLDMDKEVIRVREEQRNKVNIDQNVVHGDQITKTERAQTLRPQSLW